MLTRNARKFRVKFALEFDDDHLETYESKSKSSKIITHRSTASGSIASVIKFERTLDDLVSTCNAFRLYHHKFLDDRKILKANLHPFSYSAKARLHFNCSDSLELETHFFVTSQDFRPFEIHLRDQ